MQYLQWLKREGENPILLCDEYLHYFAEHVYFLKAPGRENERTRTREYGGIGMKIN